MGQITNATIKMIRDHIARGEHPPLTAHEIDQLATAWERGQPAASAEPAVWVAADTLNSPHPKCISSLAYMSQIDHDRGREYVPLAIINHHAAPVAAQAQPSDQDREDAERMDWLDNVAHCADWLEGEPTKRVIRASDGAEFTGDTWREAIDAARVAKGADHG